MNDKFKDFKNDDLKEYCTDAGIDIDSKNVSKPTRKEYIDAITKFESSFTDEPSEKENEEIDSTEPVFEDNSFLNEIKPIGENNGLQEEDKKTKKVETRAQKKKKQYNTMHALKRVLITSNSTNQTKTNGIERITWGNRLLGHQTDNVVIGKAWHVREGALRNMKSSIITNSIQDDEGNQVRFETVPAWNIQILEPLTEKEIEKIGRRQTIRDASIESLV